MKALVTGATGFVGSWLTQELIKDGWDITALIKDKRQSPIFYSITDKRLKTARGDVTDLSTLRPLFKDVDICFHLAAQPIVGLASSSPLGTLETNIRGTYNILEAARLAGTKVIVASSDKSYGAGELPYVEDAPLLAAYPYDVSKACCDMLSFSYFKTYGLPVTVMRFSNIFGGGDMNFSRIIPGTIRSVINNENPVIRSDGSPIRQYAYIKDIIDGYKLLASKMKNKNILGHAFNFGSSGPISVLDLIKLIIKLSGNTHLKPVTLSSAKHEIDKQYASIEKARKMLGWKPKYTFEEGLKETIDWYKSFSRV